MTNFVASHCSSSTLSARRSSLYRECTVFIHIFTYLNENQLFFLVRWQAVKMYQYGSTMRLKTNRLSSKKILNVLKNAQSVHEHEN